MEDKKQEEYLPSPSHRGFPGGSDGKAPACNAGDPGSIPGSWRSPGEGNDNPLQYSCLENPRDRGAWRESPSSWYGLGWPALLWRAYMSAEDEAERHSCCQGKVACSMQDRLGNTRSWPCLREVQFPWGLSPKEGHVAWSTQSPGTAEAPGCQRLSTMVGNQISIWEQ